MVIRGQFEELRSKCLLYVQGSIKVMCLELLPNPYI